MFKQSEFKNAAQLHVVLITGILCHERYNFPYNMQIAKIKQKAHETLTMPLLCIITCLQEKKIYVYI